jgi:hypothetical protein
MDANPPRRRIARSDLVHLRSLLSVLPATNTGQVTAAWDEAGTLAAVQDQQHQCMEVKLRPELDQMLQLLDDDLTKDILLNPEWVTMVKQMGQA